MGRLTEGSLLSCEEQTKHADAQQNRFSAIITESRSVPATGGCAGSMRGIPFIRKDLKFYQISIYSERTKSEYFILRRFNDFHNLAQQLRRDFPYCVDLPMPDKERLQTALNTIRPKALRPAVENDMLEKRILRLNEFVQYIIKDASLMAHPMVTEFFGHPVSGPGNNKISNDSVSSDEVSGGVNCTGDGTLSPSPSPEATATLSTCSLGPTEQHHMGPDDFQFLKTIGRGNFGRVFQAVLTRTNDVYAVKVLDKSRVSLTERDRHHVMIERNILVINLNHPFLVCLRFSFQTKTKLYFVMDYINGGELFFHLQKSGFFSEELSRFYSAEIASALGYLHSKDIIYRDLKPENLLLDAEGHIKLTDFGLCKTLLSNNSGKKQHHTRTYCGTPEYLAPEMIRHESYGFDVDWWCLGAVTYEMVFSLPPWYSKDHQRMHADILNEPLQLDDRHDRRRVSSSCKKFLRELLVRSPSERLGHHNDFAELKQHAFFASINWTELDARRIKPPFVPRVTSKCDLTNIDPGFQSEVVTESVMTNTTGRNDSGYCGNKRRDVSSRQQQHAGGFSVSVRDTNSNFDFEGFSYVEPFPCGDGDQHDDQE